MARNVRGMGRSGGVSPRLADWTVAALLPPGGPARQGSSEARIDSPALDTHNPDRGPGYESLGGRRAELRREVLSR
jgi:hypothetical protein